jgi:type I restriction enzyme M protein
MLKFVSAIEPDLLSGDSKLIDPSAGEGVFLSEAAALNSIKKENCFAIEKDISLNDHWHLNGYYGVPRKNVIFTDTLKLTVSASFDLVIGNPPFGLIKTDESDGLKISRYSIYNDYLSSSERKKVSSSFPMEVLFLEKFIGLCKPGGMIAIVLPRGIFANSGMEYIRQWLAKRCSIRAIVELGGRFFQSSGASAKTTLLFATKNINESVSTQDKTILAYAEHISDDRTEPDDLQSIIEYLKLSPDNKNSFNPNNSKVRILEKSISEIGTFRWDPSYYDPVYESFYEEIMKSGNPVKLSDVLLPGGIITGYKGVQKYAVTDDKVLYITSKQITDEGIDLTKDNLFVDRESPGNPKRSRVREGDILLVRSGDGCIGRAVLATPEIYGANIRSEIYILRADSSKIEPSRIVSFFRSFLMPYNKRMLHFQIRRLLSGVGTPNLNKAEIASIMIPVQD